MSTIGTVHNILEQVMPVRNLCKMLQACEGKKLWSWTKLEKHGKIFPWEKNDANVCLKVYKSAKKLFFKILKYTQTWYGVILTLKVYIFLH